MRTPKRINKAPRPHPKSTAGTIPKAALKAAWIKAKEQTRTTARENDTDPNSRNRQILRVRLRNSRQLLWHQGRKLAETQARQHRQEKLPSAPTPPMSAVSARNKSSAVRCPMQTNARAVGRFAPPAGKGKPSPPRLRRATFRGVTQDQRQLRIAANETVRSVTTQARMQTHAQNTACREKAAAGTGRTAVAVRSVIRHF